MKNRTLSPGALSGVCALFGIAMASTPAQAQKLRSSLSVDLNLHYGTGSPHRPCPPPCRDCDEREWRHHHHWRKHPPHPRHHEEEDWDRDDHHDRGRHLGWEHAPGHLRKEGRDRDDR